MSIRGRAELVDNRAKIKSFWNLAYEKLLDTTSDDPRLVLIRVHADTAEYWETGSKIKLVKKLFSKITGSDSNDTELNKTVDLE
ncbi:hypothetical protein D3C73_1493480 [compost metagenome]